MELYREPTVIAKGMENFISFQIEELQFKDSLHFLNSTLEKLVENLADKAMDGIAKLFKYLTKTIHIAIWIDTLACQHLKCFFMIWEMPPIILEIFVNIWKDLFQCQFIF